MMSTELAPVLVTPAAGTLDITGLSLTTAVGTYNPGGRTFGIESHAVPAATFWMSNDRGSPYFGQVALSIRGVFDDIDVAEGSPPMMRNCYLYCTQSSGLSDEVKFTIDAYPLEQAVGTPDHPAMQFFCTWGIELYIDHLLRDIDPTDCRGTLLLEVNRYGMVSYVDHSITHGEADVRAEPGGTFFLKHWSDEWVVSW